MEKQQHRTSLNGRVRIKDEVTHMYQYARVYSEGTVTSQIHDEHGYPYIYVEWDKDHWAYSGEEDRLVLEAHFDPVEEDMSAEDKPDFMEALAELMRQYREDGSPQGDHAESVEPDPRPTKEEDFDSGVERAARDAGKSEAFILITASIEEYNGSEIIVPHVYVHHKSEDAALFLECAVADYVSQSVLRLVQDRIEKKDEDGSASS